MSGSSEGALGYFGKRGWQLQTGGSFFTDDVTLMKKVGLGVWDQRLVSVL
jgi:hypothetical protein